MESYNETLVRCEACGEYTSKDHCTTDNILVLCYDCSVIDEGQEVAERMLMEDKLREDAERAASTGIAASALLNNASKLTSTNINEIALGNYGNYIGPVVSKLLAIRRNYIESSIERAVSMQQGQN